METNKDEKCNNEFDKYRITVEFLKYEGTMLWQIFNSFLLQILFSLGLYQHFLLKTNHNL